MLVIAVGAARVWRSELALWESASERAPNSLRAWTALSRARRLDGDLDGADRALGRVIEEHPDYQPAQVTQVYNELARGDVLTARAHLDRLTESGGGNERGVLRARQCAAMAAEAAKRCAVSSGEHHDRGL